MCQENQNILSSFSSLVLWVRGFSTKSGSEVSAKLRNTSRCLADYTLEVIGDKDHPSSRCGQWNNRPASSPSIRPYPSVVASTAAGPRW